MSRFNGKAWHGLLFGANAGGLSHCQGIIQSTCKNWGMSPCSCPPAKSFTFQQVPQAPLMSSLSVTGLGRMDRRSPQPCLFTPYLFPQRWAHNLTRVTFRVQGTLLQLLVPTASGPWRESSKSWLWFAWSSGYFLCKDLNHTWDLALKIWATLLIIFV